MTPEKWLQNGIMNCKINFPISNVMNRPSCPIIFTGVIMNVGADLCVCPEHDTDFDASQGEHIGSPLPQVVQWFKTMITNEYIRGVKKHDSPPFAGKLWQRNYFDRIIRNEDELNRIREYILYNPLKWQLDKENPIHWKTNL